MGAASIQITLGFEDRTLDFKDQQQWQWEI
jgi:hypothetical protein